MHRRIPPVVLAAALATGVLASCGDDESGDVAAFCAAAADEQQFDAVFDGLDPTEAESARAAFVEARDAQRALRDVAPGAARGDIDVVIAFVDDLIAGLEPGGEVDEQGRPRVYQALRPRFDEVEAAADRLRVYVETNC